MIVSTTQTNPTFKPLTVEIILESQMEVNNFREMMRHNVSIPAIVYNSEPDSRDRLTAMMSKILKFL
jgi:hypothetical protein